MVDQVDAQSLTEEQRAAESSWVPMATAMSDAAASTSEAAHEVAAVMHDLLQLVADPAGAAADREMFHFSSADPLLPSASQEAASDVAAAMETMLQLAEADMLLPGSAAVEPRSELALAPATDGTSLRYGFHPFLDTTLPLARQRCCLHPPVYEMFPAPHLARGEPCLCADHAMSSTAGREVACGAAPACGVAV